jgi:hypothetical protein
VIHRLFRSVLFSFQLFVDFTYFLVLISNLIPL